MQNHDATADSETSPQVAPACPEMHPYVRVCDMEQPLAVIRDLLNALMIIAETLDEEEGCAIQRLASLALRECKDAEESRGELLRGLRRTLGLS